jgi:hypothetical protein
MCSISLTPPTLFLNYLFIFIVVLVGSTLGHLQKFLQCIKYIILDETKAQVKEAICATTISKSFDSNPAL